MYVAWYILVTVGSAYWLLMAWCLFGTKASATIMTKLLSIYQECNNIMFFISMMKRQSCGNCHYKKDDCILLWFKTELHPERTTDWRDILSRSLKWRHNEHNGISNHQPRDCLLNRLFRHRSKKTSKLHVTGLCEGNSPLKALKSACDSLKLRLHGTQYRNIGIQQECLHGDTLLAADAQLLRARAAF